MPESPEPEPNIPTSPAPAPVAPPAASRMRRLWRWTRKWTKRALLLVVSATLFALIVYQIYRPFAYRAGDKELAEIRGELDRSEPDWTYERLEADYNAKLAARAKNSYALLAKFPTVHPRPNPPTGNPIAIELVSFPDYLYLPPTNELPSMELRERFDVFAEDIAATDLVVLELARSPDGAAPWNTVGNVQSIGLNLELAAIAAAARGDHTDTATYAHAALNAGRAIGEMPRLQAQIVRGRGATRATRIVGRMLAWGEPDTNLDSLQNELLAESEREWLETVLKGERATVALTFDQITPDNEMSVLSAARGLDPKRSDGIEERGWLYLARPYRHACEARILRNMTRAIGLCHLPPHERLKAFKALDAEARAGAWSPPQFHRIWQRYLEEHYDIVAKADCTQRAILRATGVALACERFRRANRRWPEALSDIPESILARIPLDPFDGQPIRYQRLDDGAVVYSIGTNLRDDGGNVTGVFAGEHFDLGTRLWDPALRGIEPDRENQPFQVPVGLGPGGPP